MKRIKKSLKPTRKESQNKAMPAKRIKISTEQQVLNQGQTPFLNYCCACGRGITIPESCLDTKNNKYYCKEHAPDCILGADELLEKYPSNKILGPETTLNPTPMSSTKIPLNGFEQIPYNSIVAICKIIKEGEKAHGLGNWKKATNSHEDLIERLVHIINHTMLFIEGDRDEDHLAKVAWGGIFMREAASLAGELGDPD